MSSAGRAPGSCSRPGAPAAPPPWPRTRGPATIQDTSINACQLWTYKFIATPPTRSYIIIWPSCCKPLVFCTFFSRRSRVNYYKWQQVSSRLAELGINFRVSINSRLLSALPIRRRQPPRHVSSLSELYIHFKKCHDINCTTNQ